MARMLYASNPGYRRRCKYAGRKGCTCYYFAWGKKAERNQKRAARAAEKRQLRREGKEEL